MTLLTRINFIRLGVADIENSGMAYAKITGIEARSDTNAAGERQLRFDLFNLSLVLTESPNALGIREVCFAVQVFDRIKRRFQRLAMSTHEIEGDDLLPHRTAIALADSLNLNFSFVECSDAANLHTTAVDPACVRALDHLVIESTKVESTAFLLASQLGLDLRMDRTNPAWGARLLFFRCGDLIIEVMHKLESEPRGKPEGDRFYGLSWRVGSAAAAHRKLTEHSIEISPLRDGRKPQTQVFTVKDRTLSTPTLILEPPAKPSA